MQPEQGYGLAIAGQGISLHDSDVSICCGSVIIAGGGILRIADQGLDAGQSDRLKDKNVNNIITSIV